MLQSISAAAKSSNYGECLASAVAASVCVIQITTAATDTVVVSSADAVCVPGTALASSVMMMPLFLVAHTKKMKKCWAIWIVPVTGVGWAQIRSTE